MRNRTIFYKGTVINNMFVIFKNYFITLRQKLFTAIFALAEAYVDGSIAKDNIPDSLRDVVAYYTKEIEKER